MPAPRRLLYLLALAACVHPAGIGGSTSDGRVAATALVAHRVELGYAALAAERATDPDVRAYAERMRTDHASLAESLGELLGRLDVAAQDDAATRALRDSSATRRARLDETSDATFDAAYVELDVRSHRELIAVVDQMRATPALRAELRDQLAAMRPTESAHLANAEWLRATLAARRR